MKIIGLCGSAGVGKDTTADQLTRLLRANEYTQIKRMSFAEKLRELCSEMLDIPVHHFSDQSTKNIPTRYDLTPRQILIKVGTDCFREIYTNVWCDYVMNNLGEGITIITDVRFQNEVDEIRNRGGNIIRVVSSERGGKVADVGDIDFNSFSHVILNNSGSINDITSQLKGMKLV